MSHTFILRQDKESQITVCIDAERLTKRFDKIAESLRDMKSDVLHYAYDEFQRALDEIVGYSSAWEYDLLYSQNVKPQMFNIDKVIE